MKTGDDINLPFDVTPSSVICSVNSSLPVAGDKKLTVPPFLSHPSLLPVCPDITHSVDEVCAMIHTATEQAKETSSIIVLVGSGLFNFPTYPEIKAAIKLAQLSCTVMVSTRTKAYFDHGYKGHTLYEPFQTLLDLGVQPLHAKNFPI